MSKKPNSNSAPNPQQPTSSKSAQVQNQVNEVIGIMHKNIEKVMDRGEKLDSLQTKTG